MSDDALFQSAWKKCAWGVAQTYQLEREVQTALDEAETDPPFTTRQEYHPEFHGFSVRIDAIGSIPPRWGLQLGDIVHAFHSSLDHLAWALVSRGKRPPSTLSEAQQRGVYFPICSSNDAFNGIFPRYLPGVLRSDIALVRKAQPYMRGGKGVARHCFTTLQHLSNTDKHRTIQPVWLRQEKATHEVLEARDCIVRRVRIMPVDALDVDTEIARVYAKKTGPDPDIALQGHIATSISIDNGMWLASFLKTIRDFTLQTLVQFAQPTFEIKGLIGDSSFTVPQP